MAKFWLRTNHDGTYSLYSQLSIGKQVLHQGAQSHFRKSDLRVVATKLCQDVEKARERHGLVGGAAGVRREVQ